MTAQIDYHPHTRPKGSRLLRLIGIFKIIKALALIVLAIAALHLIHADIVDEIDEWSMRFHIAPGDEHVQELIVKLLSVTKDRWEVVSAVLMFYSAMFMTEGIGLLLLKHWAEWMTVITTSALIPFEIYEMCVHPTWLKALAMAINVAVALYMVYRVRRESREKHAESKSVAS
jgi:uncharacterized membrane protein (DUF2068 family)